MGQRRLLGHAVGEAVVDLVGHQPDVVAPAGRDDLGEPARPPAWCPSGWRGWRRPGPPGLLARCRVVDLACGRHPARGGIGGEQHRVLAERGQDMPVAGIARATAAPPWRRRRTAPGTPARSRPTIPSSPPPARARPRRRSAGGSGRRCARAAPAAPAPPYIRASRDRAPRLTASSAARGAGVPGWPTSMWMTLCPCASRAAAASITSMTMNGGTALRREARRPHARDLVRARARGLHGRTPIAASPQTAMVAPYPAALRAAGAPGSRPKSPQCGLAGRGTRLIVGAVRVA